MCEAGESISCPSDCVPLLNCLELAEGNAGDGPCSGHGACNYLEGVCSCGAGYVGQACEGCDGVNGYFWEPSLSYCRRAQEAGLEADHDGSGVDRSSGFGSIGLFALLASGAW